MQGKFKVITLCGSSRFKKEFIEVAEKLSLEGNIVISLGLFGHADNKFDTVITPEIKEMLDAAHRAKIKMSDAIYVINRGGYIGSSTRKEIHYARALKKEIYYLEEPTFTFKGSYGLYRNLVNDYKVGKINPDCGDIYLVFGDSMEKDIYGELIGNPAFVTYNPNEGGFYKISLEDAKINLKDPYPYLGDKILSTDKDIYETKENELPAEEDIRFATSILELNEYFNSPKAPNKFLGMKYQLSDSIGTDDLGTPINEGDIVEWDELDKVTQRRGWKVISNNDGVEEPKEVN